MLSVERRTSTLLTIAARHFTTSIRRVARNSRSTLPSTPARTRFAPSPTGYLHLGSLRTALFNYLLAKKTGGQFLLRIEDTDQKRTVPGAVDRLCSDLKWAGLQWDEGPDTRDSPYGPYQQSQRTDLYKEHAQKLLASGHAYRCFCSTERLDDLARKRKELGLPTDYDRQCAGIPKDESNSRADSGQSFVVRLLAPDKYPQVNDLVYGAIGKMSGPNSGITVKHGEIAYEDPVLLKTDGHPTYHLANVVDDHFMDITHVVRATEWISSTPKHLALYEALGWAPPAFAHVGLLTDEAGHKLSKRNFDTDVAHYREMGILPSALINFVALLGWSHDQKSDIMSLVDLVEQFELHFTKGNTIVTTEKLWFLQRAHAARAALTNNDEFDDMTRRVKEEIRMVMENHTAQIRTFDDDKSITDYCQNLLKMDAKNYSTPSEFVQRNVWFFLEPAGPSPFINPTRQVTSTEELFAAAVHLMSVSADDWNEMTLKARMANITHNASLLCGDERADTDPRRQKGAAIAKSKGFNKLFHDFLRWVLLSGREGPSSAPMMALLGKDVCLRRLERCRALISEE